VDPATCILQGDVRTKVKTPGTGKKLVEEAVQTSTWKGCANFIISQSKVHAWSPTIPGFDYTKTLRARFLMCSTLDILTC
jgi:hypothetical protein